MATVQYNNNPSIIDDITIDFITTDDNGNAIDPYSVDNVTIYYIIRDFTASAFYPFTEVIADQISTMYYSSTQVMQVVGTTYSAWLSTDTAGALIEKINFDHDGNPLVGNFRYIWRPQETGEGDYVVCWAYTPLIASPQSSQYLSFYVIGDTAATMTQPNQQTIPGKYITLLNDYLPDMFNTTLSNADITSYVINNLNQSIAAGLTNLENLANQLISLYDANVVNKIFLPYLANMFRMPLRSTDMTLWRRQVKTAIPQYKSKGTLPGLKKALGNIGVKFMGLTQYWQIVSKSTWQESFLITDATIDVFQLAKTPLLPIDPLNTELYIRYVGTPDYEPISTDYMLLYADITSPECYRQASPTLTWIPDGVPSTIINLQVGDVIKVVYKVQSVPNQTNENYIRDLPVADLRDETLTTNPKKNWNVRLIAEDDPMFSVLIPTRNPFAPPVVYGKVRTEFAYSENIYNMEEFNGSLRNSNIPCDIDGNFIDACSGCASSIISVDVEIDTLTNDRITETYEVIKDNIPMHAQINTVNYSGGIYEFVLSPRENLEILNLFSFNDNVLIGQNDFNRLIPNAGTTDGQIVRDDLADRVVVASSVSGTAYNDDIVLYCPNIRFDQLGISGNNLLEILSGTNTGNYQLTDFGYKAAAIVQGMPDTIAYPLDSTMFTFRVSNLIASDSSANITQDDVYTFSDTCGYQLRNLDVTDGSNLVITTGVYAGTYPILKTYPNNTFLISGFGAVSNVLGLRYKVLATDSTVLLDKSGTTNGMVAVERRGKVSTIDLVDGFGVTQNDYYIEYAGNQYQIIGFVDASTAYIDGYTAGTVAGVAINVYRRLATNEVGYVDGRGMYLITGTNYETSLNIQDGSNPPMMPVYNSSFKVNFLIVIGAAYYQISTWNGTRIDLVGPKAVWGLSGTSVTYSIVQYVETEDVDVRGITFPFIDRTGRDNVNITITPLMMDLRTAMLNGSRINDSVKTNESVDFTIEWNNGDITEGQL